MIALARAKGVRSPMIVGDITREDTLGSRKFHLITAFRVFLNSGSEFSRQMLQVLVPKLDSKGVFIFNMHGNIWSYRFFTKLWYLLHGRTLNTISFWSAKKLAEDNGLKLVRWYGFGFVPKIFYRIFGARNMYFLDSIIAKIPFSKYFLYNLIFVCKKVSK